MPLVDLKAAPSKSMQRWFGLSLAVLLGLIALAIRSWGQLAFGGLLTLACGLGVVYYSIKKSQVPIIRAWQYATYPIAWVVGHLLFGCVFFGIVLPIGLVMRILGYDPLRLRPSQRASNWQDRNPQAKSTDSYFRQF